MSFKLVVIQNHRALDSFLKAVKQPKARIQHGLDFQLTEDWKKTAFQHHYSVLPKAYATISFLVG